MGWCTFQTVSGVPQIHWTSSPIVQGQQNLPSFVLALNKNTNHQKHKTIFICCICVLALQKGKSLSHNLQYLTSIFCTIQHQPYLKTSEVFIWQAACHICSRAHYHNTGILNKNLIKYWMPQPYTVINFPVQSLNVIYIYIYRYSFIRA